MSNNNQKKIILLYPFKLESNPYIMLYKKAMEGEGWIIIPFTIKNALKFKACICHLQWPEWRFNSRYLAISIVRSFCFFLQLGLCKIRKHRIVWTVHNLMPHLSRLPEGYYICIYTLFIRYLDGVVFLSKSSKVETINTYPNLKNIPSLVTRIGQYPVVQPGINVVQNFKEKYGLKEDHLVLGFFGLIQPYKNIDGLIKAFIELQNLDSSSRQLIIAGRCSSVEYKKYIQNKCQINSNIIFIPEFLSEVDLSCFILSCSVVVLPFNRILNSSSIFSALGLNRQVIAPNLGSIKEVGLEVGAEWIITYDGEFTMKTFEKCLNRIMKVKQEKKEICNLSKFNWDIIGKEINVFLEHLYDHPQKV